MKLSIIIVLVVSAALLAADNSPAAEDNNIGAAVRRVSAATVQVDSLHDLSSGVLITADGYILTVAHGLSETADKVNVRLASGESLMADIVSRNRPRDVALLKISSTMNLDFCVMQLCAKHAIKGTPMLAFGYPAREGTGMSPVVRLGKVVGGDETSIRSSCVVTAGDSGGPLVTTDGCLLGIHHRIGIGRQSNLHLTIEACRSALADTVDLRQIGHWATTSEPSSIPLIATPELHAIWQHRTVRILNADGEVVALGTLINSKTVVTKRSELSSRSTFIVQTFDDRSIPAELIREHRETDLSVLRLSVDVEFTRPAVESVTTTAVGDFVVGNEEANVGILARIGHHEPAAHAQLGCTLVATENGLVVDRVTRHSAAADADLAVGDRLIRLSGRIMERLGDVSDTLTGLQPGDRVTFDVERGGVTSSSTGQLRHPASELLERSEFLDGRAGELSVRRTDFRNVLQHDIPLQMQQMGGPLFSVDGRLIGVNIARRSREAVLAVPIETVHEIVSGP